MTLLEELEQRLPVIVFACGTSLLLVGTVVIIGVVKDAHWLWDNFYHRMLLKFHNKTFLRIVFFITGVAMVEGGIFLLLFVLPTFLNK